jgi:predicted outer membrane repeat protein
MNTTGNVSPTTTAGLLLALCAALLVLAAVPPRPAHAAGVVGNGTAASCTEGALRSALESDGPVSFNCGPDPATITITKEIVIKTDVEIDGGGPEQGGRITLSGGGVERQLRIEDARVTLRNLTFRDGLGGNGGAIRIMFYSDVTVLNSRFVDNDGTPAYAAEGGGAISVRTSRLTVRDSHFEGNSGINGGAIYSLATPLTVESSTFIDNDSVTGGTATGGFDGSHGSGGAIFTDGAVYPKGDATGANITIRNSVFRGNRSANAGGAVFSFVYPPAERVVIENSVFDGNESTLSAAGEGAGGALRHGNGPLTVRNTLFANNKAAGSGGAIWMNKASDTLLENVIIAGNRIGRPDNKGTGGGVHVGSASDVTIVNSTISGNYAPDIAGAISADGDFVQLRNSIVADNRANDDRIYDQCSRPFSRGERNLQTAPRVSGNNPSYPCAPAITYADPRLGPLGDNGGPFQSIALLEGSPAIDAGRDCPATDIRGAARVGPCDLGAFEFGGSAPGAEPPATPSLEPLEISGPAVRVTWGAVGGAARYELEVRSERTQSATTRAVSAGQSKHTLVLNKGGYEVRVRACNGAGCSEFSPARGATVESDPVAVVNLPLARR